MVSNASALGPRTDLDPPQLPQFEAAIRQIRFTGFLLAALLFSRSFLFLFCSPSCFDILSLYALANVPLPHHLDAIRTFHTIRGLSYLICALAF